MGLRLPRPLFLASALLITACGGTSGDRCGSGDVNDTYTDPGPWDDQGGWYEPDLGDPSASDGTSDPGNSSDSTESGGGSSYGSDSSGDGSSYGDDSSGGDGSSDDSSGDDGTDAVRHPHIRARLRDAVASAPVVATDANGCYACALTCVLSSAPAGQPNAASAVGGSEVGFASACADAQSELSTLAQQQNTSLLACKFGSS